MDRSFQRLNDESRERLARLVATLTPTQLSIDLGEGWTVASALAHTGFWDRWQGDRWEEMLSGEWTADSESILKAEHLANDALEPYWAGVAAGDVPKLALEAAERVDRLIAAAPDELAESLEGTPIAFLLHRHNHRDDHLDHIERSIAAAAARAEAGDFAERNAASRRHLAALVERLRDEDMALPTEPTEEGSWTIAQVLGHMAFWDRSLETRWKMAREAADAADPSGAGPLEPTYLPGGINEAVNRPLAELIGAWTERLGPAVAQEALAAAESLDALIVELAPRLPDGVLAVLPRVVNRWIHRESHIEQIEKGLVAGRPGAAAPATADTTYLARNGAARAELVALLGRLTDTDLARPLGHGEGEADGEWTVGIVLGHMAFWDRFLAARWRAALAAGGTQPMGIGHEMADLLNAAQAAQWAALAAAGVAALRAEVAAAADEVDAIIGSLPIAVPTDAILAERPALLDRSLHRREHLADLERVLGR